MEISGKTRLLGLIGSPVEHSKSPAMYNYCFDKWHLDYKYLAFDVPLEKTGEAVTAIRTFNMKGANVTMPCKREVIQFLDELSPAARLAGACNTIVEREGRLWGYITDGEGYVANLAQHGVTVKDKCITLLGAGGASTAIQVQTLLDGAAELRVFNKRDTFWDLAQTKIAELQAHFPKQKIALYDLDDRETLAASVDQSHILSNATKVGMGDLRDQSPVGDLEVFRKDLVVTDAVYDPAETKFLADAKAAGCRIADGLGMLLYQGAAAVKLYTGKTMPVDEIRRAFYQ